MKQENFFIVFLLIIFILLTSNDASGQNEAQWVTCTGDAAIQNISSEEAKIIALRKARIDAIEQVCGVSLQAETMVRDFQLAGDFIHSISYGHVVEEKNKKWDTITMPAENPNDPPVLIYKVTMKAKVVSREEKPDPSFKISLKLNRTIFQSGDEVVFKIKATQDCYLTIFNIGADDTVRILFPNFFEKDNFIKKAASIQVPEKTFQKAGNSYIKVSTLPGHKKNSEVVKVIATKQRIDFIDEIDLSSAFSPIGTPKMALTKLARWLSQIPVSERAEAAAVYTVEAVEK
ncbi:DUF4384 domain-containing protein [candidate division KSB1 bacterium]|nr:DUF4384 domain-containing protein [candidate division KSB1 bacterium]MBL7095578.1 DUF4384 domain-containing protein [candidate division KSB1 bacterium]